MTLEACLARIAQDWEALTPSTRIHARYHALDGSEAIYGSDPTSVGLDMVADRGFALRQDQRRFSRQRHRRQLLGIQVLQQLARGGGLGFDRRVAHRRILGIHHRGVSPQTVWA